MATLDDVLNKVTEQSGTINSMKVFIAALEQQVRDALNGVTLPPEAQRKLDLVFTGLDQNNRRIAAAIDNDPNTTGEEPSPGDTGGGDTGGGDTGGDTGGPTP